MHLGEMKFGEAEMGDRRLRRSGRAGAVELLKRAARVGADSVLIRRSSGHRRLPTRLVRYIGTEGSVTPIRALRTKLDQLQPTVAWWWR